MLPFFGKNKHSRRRFSRPDRAWASLEVLEVRSLLAAAIPGLSIDGQAPIVLPEVNGQQLLAVSDGIATTAFYSTDGTAAGTVQYAELPVVITEPLQEYAVSNGQLVFAAVAPTTIGNELWKTDGTAAGTSLVKDIHNPDVHFLTQGSEETPTELWINKLASSTTPFVSGFIQQQGLTDYLYSTPLPPGQYAYWTRPYVDGQPQGWSARSTTYVDVRSSDPSELTVVGDEILFAAFDYENGRELWKTDGTTDGTVLIDDLLEGGYDDGSNPEALVEFDDHLFFAGETFSYPREHKLYRTDGSVQRPDLVTESQQLFPVGVFNNQLVVYGLQDDDTLGLATIDDGTDTTPDFFYTLPVDSGFDPDNSLDRFFRDGDTLYFNRRTVTGERTVIEGSGRDARYHTVYEENFALWSADVAQRTVTEIDDNVLTHETFYSLVPSQRTTPAVSVGGVSLYVGAEDILYRTDGSPVTAVADRVLQGPISFGGDAYTIAYAIDGDGFPDIYKLDGTTGSVIALDIPIRDEARLMVLNDSLYLQLPADTSNALLLVDESATPAPAPVVTTLLPDETVDRGIVTFAWNPVTDAVAYELRLTYPDYRQTETYADITNARFELDLESGDYSYIVRAVLADGAVGQWTSAINFEVRLQPGPDILNPTAAAAPIEGEVLLRWRNQPNTDAHEVNVVRISAGTETVVTSYLTDQPFVFQELTAGSYRLEVNGVFYYPNNNNIAERTEVSSQLFTVAAGPLGPVISNPAAGQQLQPGEVDLTWQPVTDAVNYELRIWNTAASETTEYVVNSPPDFIDSSNLRRFTYLLPELTQTSQKLFLDGGEYRVSVRARLQDGGLTQASIQTLSVAVPAEIQFLDLDPAGPHGGIRWSAVPNVVGYQVWVAEEGSSAYVGGNFLQQWTFASRLNELSQLPAGRYHMFVRARISGVSGEDPATFVYGPWVQSSVFTLADQPNTYAQSAVSVRQTAEFQKTRRPLIEWSDHDAESYELVLNDSVTGEEVYRRTGLTSTSHTVESFLTNGRTYAVWVRAHFADGSVTRWGTEPGRLVSAFATLEGKPVVTVSGRLLSWTRVPAASQLDGHSIWVERIADDGSRTNELVIYRAVVGLTYEHSVEVDRAILNLAPGDYVVRIRGEIRDTLGAYSDEVFFTIDDGPELTTPLTYDGTTLHWTALSASKYNLRGTYQLLIDEIDADGNIIEAAVFDERIGDIQHTPRLPPGRFQARVRAFFSNDDDAFSNTVVLEAAVGTPAAPVLTTAPTESQDGRPVFEWTAVSQAVRYEIEVSDATGTVVMADTNVTTSRFQPAAPLPVGELHFKVRAVTATLTTGYSVPHGFEVFDSPVEFTDGLSPGFDQTVNFAWEDRGAGVTYELYIQKPGIAGAVYYRRNLATTSHELETPLENGDYAAWIRAWNPDGSRSRWGTANPFSIAGRPSLNATSNLVTWPAYSGATRYELWVNEVDTDGNRITSKVFYDSQLTTLQATLSDLSSGNYVAWLRAIRLDGTTETRSLWSSRIAFQIP